jgi:hypothetical protein
VLTREPFWWPMAAPPLPSEDWRDFAVELSYPVVDLYPLPVVPRRDLVYLDIDPTWSP